MLYNGTERAEHIQIIITSTQEVDNMILTQDRNVAYGYTIQVGVIRTSRNIWI